jgi:hypothetical protein
MIAQSGFDSRQGQDFSLPSLLHSVQIGSRADPAWVPESISPRVKRPEYEAGHSPPASAEVELYLHYPTCLHGIVFTL